MPSRMRQSGCSTKSKKKIGWMYETLHTDGKS